MIVYVETNFILELTLLQEEHQNCRDLLALGRQGRIDIVVPTFSVAEAYTRLVRVQTARKDLWERLNTEIGQLARSQPYKDANARFHELGELLISSSIDEKRRLDEVLAELLETAESVPLEGAIMKAATALQTTRNLDLPDAIVYASVISHLRSAPIGPHCFVTRNAKDFLTPDIRNDLAAHDCKLLSKFADALGFAQNRS